MLAATFFVAAIAAALVVTDFAVAALEIAPLAIEVAAIAWFALVAAVASVNIVD